MIYKFVQLFQNIGVFFNFAAVSCNDFVLLAGTCIVKGCEKNIISMFQYFNDFIVWVRKHALPHP